MSQEQFDHKVKKKLESVQPPFQEEAWERFRHLLPLPWYLVFLKKYGSWLYGGLTTAALVGTSYLYMQERSENAQLQQNLTTLQTTIDPNGPINTQPSPPDQVHTSILKPGSAAAANTQDRANAPGKTDTVYLVQKVYVNQPVSIKDRLLAESNTRMESTSSSSSQPVGVSGSTLQNASTRKPTAPKDANQLPAGVSGLPTSGASGAGAQIQDTAKATNAEGTTQQAISISDTKKAELATDTTRHVTKTDTIAAAAAVGAQTAKASFKLPAMHARFGLTADAVGFQRLAFGPTAELFLGERVSLGAGLQFFSPITEQLADPREFNQRKGRRFEDEYHDRIPRNDRISDIRLTTKLVRLPISLQYYFPANGNLAFLLMGGTTLDLSVQQQVAFQSSLQGRQEYNRFERKPSPNTFNNVMYGVGLQYTYGKWVGQLMPYYNYQLSDPDYRDTTPKVGISATVKLDIGK